MPDGYTEGVDDNWKSRAVCKLCSAELSMGHTESKFQATYFTESADEVSYYLRKPRASQDSNPYEWWKENSGNFPQMSKLARCYLAARASSVDNERIFSGTGKLLEPKPNRLSSAKGSMLAFLYHNMQNNFDYDWLSD